jgi:EmrB/QacA subfamily drug resistance transporter
MVKVSRWWVFAAVALGSLVGGIDGSITNTVLPVLAHDFNASVSVIGWVLMSYLLVMSSMLLTVGRLGDVAGHKRIFLMGFVVFVAASAVCGAAPNEGVLIAARAVQGCGAAMISATGVVLVTQAFGREQRGRGIGLLVAVTYFGLAIGPALGGLLAASFSWRAVFYVNLPIGALGVLLGRRVLPNDTAVTGSVQFDLKGAALSVVALTALLIGISQGGSWGWTSPAILAAFAVALLAAALFVQTELRHPAPMLDLRLFKSRLFSAAASCSVLFYVGAFFQSLLVPFYLVQGRQFSVSEAGLLLVVSPVVMMCLAPAAGWLSDRIGSRLLSSAGMAISGVGLLTLAALGPAASLTQIVLAQVIAGAGNGLFSSPNMSTIMGSAPRERQGTAAGVQAVARNFGMVLGVALASALFSARLAALGGALVPAYHDAMLVGTAIMFLGALLSSVRGESRLPSEVGLPASSAPATT